jgi:hypothetical protein
MRAVSMLLVTTATLAATFAQAAPEPREHELRAGGAVTLATGARGAASLSIVPAAGRRIDAEAPLSIRLSATPAAGLLLPRHRYALGDAADPRAEAPRFDLALEGQAAGSYTLRVEARFWLCAARSCRAVRDTVEIPVTVAAPPATTTSR